MTTPVIVIGGGHVGLTLLLDFIDTETEHQRTPFLHFFGGTQHSAEKRARNVAGDITFEEVLFRETTTVTLETRHFSSFYSKQAIAQLRAADSIFITVPDIPKLRLELIDQLIRSVDLSDKLITFVRGGQGGQPVIANYIVNRPELAKAHIVLIEDSFYGTRFNNNRVKFKRKLNVNISIYSNDKERALSRLRELFPRGANVSRPSWPDFTVRKGLDLLFDPLGYIIHVGPCLWQPNLKLTKAGIQYKHYTDGISKPLAKQLNLLDKERVELANNYGVDAETFPEILNRQYGINSKNSFYETMQECRSIYSSLSSSCLSDLCMSRLIHEDVPAMFTIEWLMESAQLELPATRCHINSVKRSLLKLGIDVDDLRLYVPFLKSIRGCRSDIAQQINNPRLAQAA